MARRFIGTGQVPYIGVPYTRPVPICTAPGGKPQNTAVPLQFDWNAYQASSVNNTINVKVSLSTPDVNATLLQSVKSVYIDNTNSNVPIYVYAPDTQYVATAQPNSAGWYPLYTNAFELWVIGIGFVTGHIPYTTVFVSDLFVPPYTDQEINQSSPLYLASPTITRGNTIYNQNYGVPALGDQTQQVALDITAPGVNTPLFLTPLSSGFVYITSLSFSVLSLQQPSGPSIIKFRIRSTGVSGVLYAIPFYFQANILYTNLIVYSQSGLQLKIDATQSWIFDADTFVTLGQIGLIITYTTNPQ